MARLGRGYPARPRVVWRLAPIHARLTLDPFETEAEFPALSVTTPSARVLLGPFETEAEFPGLTISNGQSLTLAPFETEAEFPALSVTTPIRPGDLITGNYQIEYGGLLFGGHGNVYQIIAGTLEGWGDLPALDSGNVVRPNRHGSWAGRKLAQERQVSVVIAVNANDDFAGALTALRLALAPLDDESGQPLAISSRDEILLVPEAAVDARVQPTQGYPAGWVPVSVRWTCADPRLFNIDQSGVSIPVSQTVSVVNAGNTATHPVIRIPGPVEDPIITNLTLGRTLQFEITVGSGQQLEIDADEGNATVSGDSVMATLTGSSAPVADFVFGRGTNQILYTASSGGSAPATALWRDAWL